MSLKDGSMSQSSIFTKQKSKQNPHATETSFKRKINLYTKLYI
jgi:hypothetical protein